jgi:hypothetical protein
MATIPQRDQQPAPWMDVALANLDVSEAETWV